MSDMYEDVKFIVRNQIAKYRAAAGSDEFVLDKERVENLERLMRISAMADAEKERIHKKLNGYSIEDLQACLRETTDEQAE